MRISPHKFTECEAPVDILFPALFFPHQETSWPFSSLEITQLFGLIFPVTGAKGRDFFVFFQHILFRGWHQEGTVSLTIHYFQIHLPLCTQLLPHRSGADADGHVLCPQPSVWQWPLIKPSVTRVSPWPATAVIWGGTDFPCSSIIRGPTGPLRPTATVYIITWKTWMAFPCTLGDLRAG